MKTIHDNTLKDTTPDSIIKDAQVQACIEAIDRQLKAVAGQVDTPSIYSNIDSLTSLELDHLAQQFDVDVWRDGWNLTVKRNVLKTAIYDKRKKGTLSAVRQAISSLGGSATIVEWWQENPKGEPHTFKINAVLPNIDGYLEADVQEDLLSLVDGAKPLRSHYSFVLNKSLGGSMGATGFLRAITIGSVRTGGTAPDGINAILGTITTARSLTYRHLIGKAK